MTQANDQLPPLSALLRVEFSHAKSIWGLGTLLTMITSLLGALVPLVSEPSYFLSAVIPGAGIVGYLACWHADSLRGRAESLFRKLEAEDFLGWPLSEKERRDAYALGDEDAATAIKNDVANYWASKEVPGPRRAVEGVQESAWWSEHLARTMALVIGALAAGCLILAVSTLFAVMGKELTSPQAGSVANAILVLFALSFSGGFMRLAIDYRAFSVSAASIDSRAEQLLADPRLEAVQAIRILHDYQVIRVKAPPLPDLVHRLRKKSLERLWSSLHRAR